MRPLIGSDLVAIGYMHHERWQQTINTYAKLNIVPADFSLDGFLYSSDPACLRAGTAQVADRPQRDACHRCRRDRRRQPSGAPQSADEVRDECAKQPLRNCASEQRFRFMAENTADVIWILDIASGRFSYVSPSVQSLRGFTVEE